MIRSFHPLVGSTLAASDGEIGKVREFYFDDEHWTVRYFVVQTGSWLSGREVLIAPRSLGEIDLQSGTVAVGLTQKQVENAPPVGSERPVSRQYEKKFYEYYGWESYWGLPGSRPDGMLPPPASALPVRPAPPPPEERKSPGKAAQKLDQHLRSSGELMSGYSIHAQDGEIGRVTDFLFDDSDWRVRYLVVHTGLWFLGKDVLLSPEWIEHISFDKSEVFVNLPRSLIKTAPAFDASFTVARPFEERLHDHYGMKRYWEAVKKAKNRREPVTVSS